MLVTNRRLQFEPAITNPSPRTARKGRGRFSSSPSNGHPLGTAQIHRSQQHNSRPPQSALLDTFWRLKKCRPRQGVLPTVPVREDEKRSFASFRMTRRRTTPKQKTAGLPDGFIKSIVSLQRIRLRPAAASLALCRGFRKRLKRFLPISHYTSRIHGQSQPCALHGQSLRWRGIRSRLQGQSLCFP